MIPFTTSQLHMLLDHPHHRTLNKGSLSPPTLLAQLFPPVYHPCHQYYHISILHLALLSRKHHFLDSCRSPSVDDNSSILEDRPRGPCALDPSPSVVSAYGPFWEESLLPLRLVVSHMFDFSTLFASLRIAQDIYPFHSVSKTPDFPRL